MAKEVLVSLGESGNKVKLIKKSIKTGSKSNIKPGKERLITLHKPISVGHPIVSRKISSRARTEGVIMGYQKTTIILNVEEKSDGSFILETETSFYEVMFI